MCIHIVGFNWLKKHREGDFSMNDVHIYYWNDCAGMGINRFSLDVIFKYCPRCGKNLINKGRNNK